MEAEFGGLKFKGGKVFGILLALGTLIGSLYGGFVAFKDYQDMKSVMLSYSAPDLSGLEKELALIEQEVGILSQEMQSIISEVSLVSNVANELKNDLRTDLRRVESIIEDVEGFFTNESLPDTMIPTNNMAQYFLFGGSNSLMDQLVDSQYK